MAYVKNNWVDQDVERPKTYQVTTNQDGSITLTDDFGIVTELGTPVNAVNMNHIEDGIYTNDTHIGDLTQLSTTVKTDLVSAINEANGGSSRNIGEIVTSTVPLSDAGLHLLDGTKLYGSGYNAEAFTVVGTPTITDDGVASDFSGSDYIYSSINITSNNTFKISCTFTTSSTRSSSNKRILKLAPNNRLMICDADYLRVWLGEGSSWNVKEGWQITTSQLAGDTKYKIDVEYTGTEYKVYLNNELMQTYSSNKNILQSITDIYLGYDTSSTSNYFTGSIDLKELQIGVDGGIVLNGNTAGISSNFVDYVGNIYNKTKTYNSDVFTVVGSPTITADGIASGFSASNNLTSSFSPVTPTQFLVMRVKAVYSSTPNAANGSQMLIRATGANSSPSIEYKPSANILEAVRFHTSSTSGSASASITVPLNDGDIVEAEVIATSTSVTLNAKVNGVSYTNTWSGNGIYCGALSGFSATNSGNWYWTGSIDLKESQIGVDGDIIFSGSKANGFCLEDDWQTSVTNYGVCGKYVYNPFDNTVRLPKITGFIEGGTVSTLGDLTEAGLPNITGHFGGVEGSSPEHDGAFYIYSGGHPGGANGTDDAWVGFDASLSNPIYDNSNTVQPQSVKVLYYVVVGTTTKTSVEVDIDDIATDLNGKADVDLSNVNDTGTSKVAGWAMPSTTYDTLTLGASGASYTAPANGWVFISKKAGTTQKYVSISVTNKMTIQAHSSSNDDYLEIYMPVAKSDVFSIAYNATGSTEAFRFIYAKGSESEA